MLGLSGNCWNAGFRITARCSRSLRCWLPLVCRCRASMPLPSDARRRLSLACLRLPCAVASITRLPAGVAAPLLAVTTMPQRQPRSQTAHAPWPTWPRASRSWHHCDGPRPRRMHHRAAVPPRAVLPPKYPGHAGQQELGRETMTVEGNARGPAWRSARSATA